MVNLVAVDTIIQPPPETQLYLAAARAQCMRHIQGEIAMSPVPYLVPFNNATQLARMFFHNCLSEHYLNEINVLDIKRINIIENAETEDIKLPSYKMISIVVYLLSRDGRVDSWVIDLGLAKQQGRTPESLVQGLVMMGSSKMMLVTKSASRRDDTRFIFIDFN